MTSSVLRIIGLFIVLRSAFRLFFDLSVLSILSILLTDMGDWIGLGIIVLVLAGSLWGLAHLGKTREPMSEEEFERRAAESRGAMSAGVAGMMYALQKLMNPKAAEAVEVQKDLQAGYYDESEQAGEGGEGEAPEPKKDNLTKEEGADA